MIYDDFTFPAGTVFNNFLFLAIVEFTKKNSANYAKNHTFQGK